MHELEKHNDYNQLINNIGVVVTKAREKVYKAINAELIKSHWITGKYIVEYEQKGKIKAEYGKKLLLQISKDLKIRYGKGFSKSNVFMMRNFYLKYPTINLLSDLLSWSHYYELLKIDDNLERNFYEKQAINDRWSIRELRRQKKAQLFLIIADGKDKKGILELSKKGHQIKESKDIIKTQVLEFLDLPEDHTYTESELEQSIIDNLQKFLLELGKGFAFVGRQYRITLNNRHFL